MKNNTALSLITVVVPIYNIEELIERCVDSILSQTYDNLEIILVDDGSTDTSGAVCDQYKKIDKRVKVIHKKNGGLSDARNAGIDIARGQYITFVDGDDYLAPKMIETLYRGIQKSGAEISTCLYQPFFGNDTPRRPVETTAFKTYDTQDGLAQLLYQQDISTSAWGKLYDLKLFNGIRYPYGEICEDLATTYLLFGKSKKMAATTAPLYFYFQREDSIIHTKFKPARLNALGFCEDIIKYMSTNFPQLLPAAYNRMFAEGVFVLERVPLGKPKIRKQVFTQAIKPYRKIVLGQKQSRKMFRIYALIALTGSTPFSICIKVKTRLQTSILRKAKK